MASHEGVDEGDSHHALEVEESHAATDIDTPSFRRRRRSRPSSRYSSVHLDPDGSSSVPLLALRSPFAPSDTSAATVGFDLEDSVDFESGVRVVRTVEEKHEVLNSMFGFKPWKSMDKPFYDPGREENGSVSKEDPSLQVCGLR